MINGVIKWCSCVDHLVDEINKFVFDFMATSVTNIFINSLSN